MTDRPLRLDVTPEVERMTISATAGVARRADRPVEAEDLRKVQITPRLLMACAYLDSLRKKGWEHQRVYDTCRALGYKPQELANAAAIVKACGR